MKQQRRSIRTESPLNKFFSTLILGALILLLALMALTYLLPLYDRFKSKADEQVDFTPSEEAIQQVWEEAQAASQRADEATQSAALLLSFLEGASVLVALALGGAAIYGFRNSNETQRKINQAFEYLGKKLEQKQ